MPSVLYFVRIAQLLFGIGFLILVADASVHRGWWDNINGAVGLGVVATVLTLALTLQSIISHHLSKNPFSGGSAIRTILRLVIEVIVLLCWIGTVGLMLRSKGGCDEEYTEKGLDACKTGNSDHWYYKSDQPLARWDIGIAFDFIEIVLFIASCFFTFREDRATKVPSGGASYA